MSLRCVGCHAHAPGDLSSHSCSSRGHALRLGQRHGHAIGRFTAMPTRAWPWHPKPEKREPAPPACVQPYTRDRHRMSQLLLSKISAVRAKHSSVAIGTGIALAITALVVGLALGMLLDWWLDLPRWVRAAFLAVDLALLVTIIVQAIILPIVVAPDEDEIALR